MCFLFFSSFPCYRGTGESGDPRLRATLLTQCTFYSNHLSHTHTRTVNLDTIRLGQCEIEPRHREKLQLVLKPCVKTRVQKYMVPVFNRSIGYPRLINIRLFHSESSDRHVFRRPSLFFSPSLALSTSLALSFSHLP